ncbi:hypothetical protein MON38_06355 [Hymenobacter sp. DH14]|uniref:Uncharacterized protein n=1 Tax=Hymenobacter cyanobacteriorum TaxID=2926463 RepID=A0A9X1VDB0_9BACT|nr:hypothetical protein [Hymenobacter cyanobacteriorum]MCI1187034.1 hypothetical protein [Hymenobacter cyanobacteriorum]
MRFISSALAAFICFSAGAQPREKSTKTNPALPPWETFRVDEHLELQIPVPARLVSLSTLAERPAQAYAAAAPQLGFSITRASLSNSEAAAMEQPGQQDNLYTSFTQGMLTRMHAVRVRQATFRTGRFEGLAVQFRVDHPAANMPSRGTMWILRAGTSVYLLQALPIAASETEEATAMQDRFLASLVANDAPYTPPVPADWARFKTGRFRYLDPIYKAVTIIRTDTTQTEIDTARGMQIVYRLRWTQDGYELNQIASTFPNAAAMQGKPIKVRITQVDGNMCAYQGNLAGVILTGRIEWLGQ